MSTQLLREIGGFLTGFVLILTAVAAPTIVLEAYGGYICTSYEKMTGKETRYIYFDHCYVKTAQGFQRLDAHQAQAKK